MGDFFKVSELFVSLQGEGANIGKPRAFIRLAGCNRSCEWCDSKLALNGEGRKYTVDEVVKYIHCAGLSVVWTGGEPTLQQDLIKECRSRVDWCFDFDIETNGIISIEDPEMFASIVVSPKIDSGDIDIGQIISKYKRVNAQYGNVIFKFAVSDPKIVKDIIDRQKLPTHNIYAMPITPPGRLSHEDELKLQSDFAKECMSNGVNFSPRLHRLFNIM